MDHLDWPLTALPDIRTAGRFPLDDRGFDTLYQTSSHALHVHDYAATLQLGSRTIALRPGDLTISPAGVASRYDLPAPGHHWCVHFMPADATGPAASLPLHLPLGSLGGHAGQRIMHIAQTRAGGADPVACAAAGAAMLELLLWVAMQTGVAQRSSTLAAGRGIAAAERVAAILHERLEDPLSIPDLAAEVELTQNYLARIFRLRYGMTMPHFLLTCRMDHAKHLLAHTSLPVGKVAARAGLPDVQHFNKQFRKLVGVSPTAYRSRTAR
jgi:AraC-like DNA-binding protein